MENKEYIKDVLVYGVIGGIIISIITDSVIILGILLGVVATLFLGIICGITMGLIFKLVLSRMPSFYALVIGLNTGLSYVFFSNILFYLANHTNFNLIETIIAFVLLIIVQIIGWYYYFKLKEVEE